MAISEVIKFEGQPNDLVWKHYEENFNTTSQLIVDETHEALLVVNGNAADLFGPGRRTLSTSNIPLLRKIVEIPTGGKTPFPCKVFFINKVHQMDMKWGTQSAIPLEDPLYDIFMHVMLHGSMSISVDNSRKFMLKLVGFGDRFSPEALIAKFRGIISSYVKDSISKIMIEGKLSYFMISANLLEISGVVKEKLDDIFEDYGVNIEFFNIEAIEVPDKDYAEISAAKKLRSSRLIQGYTWQEERQMMIAEKFAANEGGMGEMAGLMGGAVGGMVMGSTIAEVAKNALSTDRIPTQVPPKNVADIEASMGSNSVKESLSKEQPKAETGEVVKEEPKEGITKFCVECGTQIDKGAKFCPECGAKQMKTECPACGNPIKAGMKFCPECGEKL